MTGWRKLSRLVSTVCNGITMTHLVSVVSALGARASFPERTTPTLGVEISGFFPPATLKSYYSVLVDRHCQIGDVLI